MADPVGTPMQEQMARLSRDQQNILKRSVGVGAPGTPTLKPVTDLGGGFTTPAPKPDEFPALERAAVAGVMRTKGDVQLEKFEADNIVFNRTETGGSGFAFEKGYTPTIADINKVTPKVKIQQVIDFTNPLVKERWMADDIKVANKDGEAMSLDSIPTLEGRIEAANKWGAVKILTPQTDVDDQPIVNPDTGIVEMGEDLIPWDNLIYDMSKIKNKEQVFTWRQGLPNEGSEITRDDVVPPTSVLVSKQFKDMTPKDIDNLLQYTMIGSLNMLDKDIRKALYADFLNRRLIRAGMTDTRTRAAVIQYGINAPLMGDIEKMAASVGENAIRLPIEMALGLVGETLDIAEDIFEDNVSINKGDVDQGWMDIRQPARRQAIMDTVWQTFSHRFIDRMAQQGVTITLAEAEAYRDTLTGALPRMIKTTGEFALPSRLASGVQLLKGNKELARLQTYIREEVERGSKKSYDDMVSDYIAIRSESSLPLLGKFKQSTINAKLTRGFQAADAKLSKTNRAEVVAAEGYVNRLQQRKRDLLDGAEARIKRGEDSGLDNARMEALDADISSAIAAQHAVERISGTPKFMRDANIGLNPKNFLKNQDGWMILGAGSAGHYFQQQYEKYDWKGDPMLGEATGMGVGLVMSILKGSVPQMLQAFNNSRAGQVLFSKMPWGSKSKASFEKWIVQNTMNLSPELQQGIIERVKYLDELKATLVRQGVRAETLSEGFASLTGFVTLKAIEDVARQSLSMADAKSFKISDLETIAQHQQRFLEQLRGVLFAIGETTTGTPKDDFARILANTIEEGQNSIDALKANIDVINKHGVTHYLDLINGNSKKYANQMDVSSKQSFVAAQNDLVEQNLLRVGELDSTTFLTNVTEPRDMIARTIADNANNMRSRISDAAWTDFQKAFPDGKVTVAGMKVSPDIINFEKSGDMLSATLETAHTADKAIAQRPFAVLDYASKHNKFVTKDGTPIAGDITVDVGDVFSALFSGRPDALKKLRKGQKDVRLLDEEFINISNPYFAALGEADGLTAKEVVSKIKKTLEDPTGPYKVTFVRGLSDQTQVVQFLRQFGGEGVGDFRVPFTRLTEFESIVSGMAHQASRAGLVDDASTYNTVKSMLMRKFDEFEAVGPNGELIPVDQLHVMDDGVPTSVKTMLLRGKAAWADYKSRWYDTKDGNVVPDLMSWGNRDYKQKSSPQYPAAVAYADNTEKWIDIAALSNPDKAADLSAWAKSMNRAIGKEQLNGDVMLVEGDALTDAFAATMKKSIAEYVVAQRAKLNPDDLMNRIQSLEAAFTMVGKDGSVKQLFKMENIIDDTIAYSRKSIGDEAHEAAEAMKNSAIKSHLTKTLEPARNLVKLKEEAIQAVQGYSLRAEVNLQNIGEILLSGGETGLQRFKQNMKTLGRTDAEIDQVVTDVVADYITRSSIIDTGRSSIKGGVNTKDIDFNPVSLLDKIGANDPERAKLLISIVGKDRYDTWNAIARIASERGVRRSGDFNVTGVPTSFSVESYISRFYAINRGVISPRYVGTEALLQQFRNSRFDIFHTMLTDPTVGEAFIEMVRTGKPLSPIREKQLFNALAASLALNTNAALVSSGIKPNTTIQDEYGQNFIMDPFPLLAGTPTKTGPDARVGEGVDIPRFGEFEKRKKDFPVTPNRVLNF